MSDWFAGTDFKFAVPTISRSTTPVAARRGRRLNSTAGWSPRDGPEMNSVPNPADNNPPDPADTVNFVRFQVVAEVTEMFMYSKQNRLDGRRRRRGE